MKELREYGDLSPYWCVKLPPVLVRGGREAALDHRHDIFKACVAQACAIVCRNTELQVQWYDARKRYLEGPVAHKNGYELTPVTNVSPLPCDFEDLLVDILERAFWIAGRKKMYRHLQKMGIYPRTYLLRNLLLNRRRIVFYGHWDDHYYTVNFKTLKKLIIDS